ncbi:MAG: sulfatase [Hyphomicrobiales bacterium]|nr:MAG: sulfatase [Hyphomicrobiales bacterium]
MQRARLLARLLASPICLLAISAAGLSALVWAENQTATVPFALSIVVATMSIAYVISGRIAFSVYCGWSIMGLVALISVSKFKLKGFSLHFYDFVFVARDADIYDFLIGEYTFLFMSLLSILVVGVVVLTLIWRDTERRASSLRARLLPTLAAGVALPLSFPAEAAQNRYFYYLAGRHASAFFISLLDIEHLIADGSGLARLADHEPQPPFDPTPRCRREAGQPDVHVILQESRPNLSDFPQLAGNWAEMDRARGLSAPIHPLQVETFGGGTWISNLSVMTGLSTADFGWRSPYLTITLNKKVRGALPAVMAACGYRTVAILPMKHGFVNEGPFLESIGFQTVLDATAIGSEGLGHRDHTYFDAAERFIAEHRRTDGRPLFLLVQTLFAHGPYHQRLARDVRLADEPVHGDKELSEYLRRLSIARSDFLAFMDVRRQQRDQRPSVVLEFGDHHAAPMLGPIEKVTGDAALANLNSLAYRTYFSIHGFGHRVDRQVSLPTRLDIGFLPTVLIQKAGLPTSAMFEDLASVRDTCDGRFYTCERREIVDRHLRKRIDSGLLDVLRPGLRAEGEG